jgi:hypothetical protein
MPTEHSIEQGPNSRKGLVVRLEQQDSVEIRSFSRYYVEGIVAIRQLGLGGEGSLQRLTNDLRSRRRNSRGTPLDQRSQLRSQLVDLCNRPARALKVRPKEPCQILQARWPENGAVLGPSADRDQSLELQDPKRLSNARTRYTEALGQHPLGRKRVTRLSLSDDQRSQIVGLQLGASRSRRIRHLHDLDCSSGRDSIG